MIPAHRVDSAASAPAPPGARRSFSRELEAEYSTAYLFNSRKLIRVTCLLAAALAVMRTLEQVIIGPASALVLAHFAFAMVTSIGLAVVAWAPSFPRFYLTTATLVVPVRNSLVAVYVAYAVAAGGVTELMVLPLMIVGPFFFLGLPFRAALLTCSVSIASFIAAAVQFGVPAEVLMRVCTLLAVAGAGCAVGARHLEIASRRRFLESRTMTELAEYDALTGTKNRRMFDEHLMRVWELALKEDRSIAVMLIDVDHFKAYNDRYGHQAGDVALRRIAECLKPAARRPLDIVARYGGEEFAVILFDADAEHVRGIADELRRTVESCAIEHAGSRTASIVTTSIGVALVKPTAERMPRGALQLADEALYVAKRNGRNRVEIMGDAEYRMLVTGVFAVDSKLRAAPRSETLQR